MYNMYIYMDLYKDLNLQKYYFKIQIRSKYQKTSISEEN